MTTKQDLITSYKKRIDLLDNLIDECSHQLRLAKKEKPDKVNSVQIPDMEKTKSVLLNEWSLTRKFIEELNNLD